MKNIILKQAMMNKVLYALIPSIILSVFLFGWRSLVVILFTNVIAFLTEFLFIRKKPNGKVSMAVFVTGTLLAMTLPPTIPLWIAGVGAVIAVAFGKMVFGGFGMNIFNPAIVGRTFIYVSFPQQMTIDWVKPFTSLPGGFANYMNSLDMRTSATILSSSKLGQTSDYNLWNAFTGIIPGSLGETSALLIILGAIYLVITKTAKWQPMIATLVSLYLFNVIFYGFNDALYYVLSGGALFGIAYMVTDPVSQAKTKNGLWIYGILIGFLTVFIRKYSLFSEGFMFAILLANTFMPIIEFYLNPKKKGAK
ncbi:RnfABCDGE type electron transport complex subunit D [bacterium]|nr:RnfABCDGE type electron transport complex subunit D [bacterium]